MKKKILIAVLCVAVILVGVLSGCTESLKQKPIDTKYSDIVSSNGGMAVVYGDYLYFINGYAGQDVDNNFGDVVKGAIARVSLSDGKPDGKAQIIVPKNVYGTDKVYGGIYIVDHYIYYATTNTDLDSEGKAKTAEMVIMRTKVDGSDSSVVAKFEDHTVVFKVEGKKLVYVRNNGIYSISLDQKKFPVTTIEESIVSSGYLFAEGHIFYTVTNEGNTSDYILKAYPIAGGESKVLLDSKKLDSSEKTLYTITMLSVTKEADGKLNLFYTKTDNGINTPEAGIYSYIFDTADFAFDKDKEVRLTYNKNDTTNLAYKNFYKAGNYYLGLDTNRFDVFKADGTRETTTNKKGEQVIASIDVGSAVTYFDIEITDTELYLWYINNSAVYKIKMFDINNGVYTFVEANATKIFSGTYDSTYVTTEKVGNMICYFNSTISNNAYYYQIPEEITASTDTASGKVLGIITQTDIIAAF
ncbi:hypothetical protein EOM82_00785 [bacterium]|nr:hypothetical protein [bacterium]